MNRLLRNARVPALVGWLAALTITPLNAETTIPLPQPDGTILKLEQVANRVVTLSPHLAELMYAAGSGDYLVATVEYSDYPPLAKSIPRVGDAFRIDVERIVALNPDLVIAWESGNPAPALDQLRGLGLAVWSVEIRELDQLASVLELMGKATNNSGVADRQARVLRQRQLALNSRYSDLAEVSYFYQVDEQPLFTINGDHLISKGLEACGGRNIFADEGGLAFQVAHESVVAADPDALLAPWLEGQENPLASWRSWSRMKSVRNNAVFLLNADQISRATPRLFDSLERACKLLHKLRQQDTND